MNICIIGRPNAGKSTLINRLSNRKVSAVSPKANTTRFATRVEYKSSVLEDTPGWDAAPRGKLNKLITGLTQSALLQAQIVILLVDGSKRITSQDKQLYEEVTELGKHVEITLSKTDLVKPKSLLLPKIAEISSWGYTGVVWLVSVKNEAYIKRFEDMLSQQHLTNSDATNQPPKTHMSPQLFAQECTREHAFRLLNQEIPYGLWVETKTFTEEGKSFYIEQVIRVLHDRHKGIVLGKNGGMIKKIGSRARVDLMKHWDRPVRLYIQVKVGKEADLLHQISRA